MLKLFTLTFALLAAGAALAEDAPTVTLTQAELQSLIQAENAKAVAAYIVRQESDQAKASYAKVEAAFAKRQPAPPQAPEK